MVFPCFSSLWAPKHSSLRVSKRCKDVRAMRLGRLPSALLKGRGTSTVTLRWSDGREAGTFLPKFLRENTQDARLEGL